MKKKHRFRYNQVYKSTYKKLERDKVVVDLSTKHTTY